MVNQFSVQPWVLRLAGIFLSTTVSVATAAPPMADYKQGSNLAIEASGLPAGTQLALIPGDPYLKFSSSVKTPLLDLSLHGDHAYAAAGRDGLLIFEIAADAPPRVVAQIEGQGSISHVVVHDGRAYVADTGALLIVDVRDPHLPQRLARHPLAGSVDALCVEDGRAYLVSGKQLTILDVATPNAPRQLTRFTLATAASAIRVADGHVFLALPKDGMSILDVRDPAHIREVGRFRGTVSDLAVVQGRAYLANGTTGLTILDVSDPSKPIWLGSVNRPGNALGLYYDDGHIALRNDRSEVALIDARNPKAPRTVSVRRTNSLSNIIALAKKQVIAGNSTTLDVMDFSAPIPEAVSTTVNFGGSRRGVICDNILYVADWFSGLHLYDISDPVSPRHLSAFHTQGSPKGVVVRGDYAFVGDDDYGVQILDISDPQHIRKVSEVPTDGLAYTMKLIGDYLYLADHRGGFYIINVADVAHPFIASRAATGDKAWAVEVVGNLAYVAADTAGVVVFDVSDPQHPKQISAYDVGGAAEEIVIRGTLAYVASFDNGFHVLDVSDPAQPRGIGHLATPANARSIELDGNIAYLADWVSGIQVIDISNPEQPASLGSYDTVGWSWGVLLQQQHAYVLDWWGGITVLDVSDPTTPAWAGAYHARGITRDVSVKDNYAYVADGTNGLQIFDIKTPLYPIWSAAVDMPGDAQSVWLEGKTAYVACGTNGLAAIDIANPFEPHLLKQYSIRADSVRAQGKLVYAVERQRGVAVVDAATGQSIARHAANVLDSWPDANGRLLVATPKGIDIVGMDDPAHPRLIKHLPQRASLVRVQEKLLVLYDKRSGIALYDYATLKLLSRFNPGEEISDLKISGNRLYASGNLSGLLVLDISEPRHPALKAAYPAASGVTNLSVFGGAAFMAGNETLTSVRLLPDVAVSSDKKGNITVKTPPQVPLGSYHLLALDPRSGKRTVRHDAVRVAMPAAKTRFNLQDYEKAMRERGLKPSSPQP